MIDRERIAELVREALGAAGAGKGATAAQATTATGLLAGGPDGAIVLGLDRGRNLGEPFDPRAMAEILAATPARIGVGRAGPRYRTNTMLRFRADHAAAKDAVQGEVDPKLLEKLGLPELRTNAESKAEFLRRPDRGRALHPASRARVLELVPRGVPLVIIYGDGLSAAALNEHLETFHGTLVQALAARGVRHAPAFFVRYSRVKVMDEVVNSTGAEAALFLCGERPGLGFADSMSVYYMYRPPSGATDADREVISNICPRGTPPADAAAKTADAIVRVLRDKKSGVILG